MTTCRDCIAELTYRFKLLSGAVEQQDTARAEIEMAHLHCVITDRRADRPCAKCLSDISLPIRWAWNALQDGIWTAVDEPMASWKHELDCIIDDRLAL